MDRWSSPWADQLSSAGFLYSSKTISGEEKQLYAFRFRDKERAGNNIYPVEWVSWDDFFFQNAHSSAVVNNLEN